MTEQFAGRVAFITGAGSGIGRATALAFAAQGAAVTASDKSEKDVHETARLIEVQGGQALPVLRDVTRSDDVAAAVAAAVGELHLADIAPRPILLITGEQAHSRWFSDDVHEQSTGPKERVVVPGARHTDLYDRTDLIPFDTLETFFTKNLSR